MPGVTLEEKEGDETAGHHEGEQEEEDHGREVGGEVVALQMDRGELCSSEARHEGAIMSLKRINQRSLDR